MMSDGSTISSCVQNADGSYLIELSNGTKFTAMPDSTSFASLVSCVVVNGKKCWATCDPTGNLVPLKDASGKTIPVDAQLQVKLVDGVYYLMVNGQEFPTGYDTEDIVQIFSSCTPMTDASGQVYAVKFTIGEGLEITVTVDGYKGVLFKASNKTSAVLTGYYVDFGQSVTLYMDTQGVVDYIMQIPDGWRVVESENKSTAELYVTITAPAQQTVDMGAAVASGDLKVVSVVEGGKAAVTKLTLSTNPYRQYEVTAMRAKVETYAGVDRFVYGVASIFDFDKEEIISKVNDYLASSSAVPSGMYVSTGSLDKAHSEINTSLVEDETYVFWVVPVSYRETEEESGYYAMDSMFRQYSLTPISVEMSVSDVELLDAKFALKIKGCKQMYAGIKEKAAGVIEEIVTEINNEVYEVISDEALFSYQGSVLNFPDPEYPVILEPGKSYVVWVVPIETGKTQFNSADVVYQEFTTLTVEQGGSLAVEVSEPDAKQTSVSFSVSCDDAAMIYYAFLDKSTGSRYAEDDISNETKYNKLIGADSFQTVFGNSAEALVEDLIPGTTVWLYAVPVGRDGLIGKVKCVSAKSADVSFNSLTVTLDVKDITSEEATVEVSVAGGTAEEYVYWVGRQTDDFWVKTLKKDRNDAGKFMAANPDADAVVKSMNQFGPIGADGKLKLTDLSIKSTYIVLVVAKDASGKYSKAGYKLFETESISLGDGYAPEGSEKWNAAKQFIETNIVWDEAYFQAGPGQGQGFAAYAFEVKIPTDLTAYISCYGTKAEFEGGSLYDIMVEIEQSCLARTANNPVVKDPVTGEDVLLPDWTDDTGRLIQGSMLNVYQPYCHGNPDEGEVTYFASEGHDDHCSDWENGECSVYADQVAGIEELKTLEYWIEHFKGTAGNWDTGDPSTSRVLKDEANLLKVAKSYQDIHIKYYEGIVPRIYINDGSALRITNREASGVDDKGNVVDVVTIMLKDLEGNDYDPMKIQVPNYFK